MRELTGMGLNVQEETTGIEKVVSVPAVATCWRKLSGRGQDNRDADRYIKGEVTCQW